MRRVRSTLARATVGFVLLAWSVAIVASFAWAQTPAPDNTPAKAPGRGKNLQKRAQPPKFTKDDPFFPDAFNAGLRGDRPANLSQTAKPTGDTGSSPTGGDAPAEGSSGTAAWSQWIAAATLEDEVKAQKKAADANVVSPTDFAGKGYSKCRREFCIAAVVFAVINEYDGEVRFKKNAAGLRDAFARAAGNCKTGSNQAFNEAKQRKSDLSDLVGGQPIETKEADAKNDWSKIVDDRAPLMQRLDTNYESLIKAMTSDKDTFKKNVDTLAHEAQIFAMIGETLCKQGMESADDAEYVKLAGILKEGGATLARGCKDNDFSLASKGATMIGQSCDKCHEAYR